MSTSVLSVSLDPETEAAVRAAKMHALREGRHFSISGLLRPAIARACRDYVHQHGEGNPAYPLDHWAADPEMRAAPALFRRQEVFREYLEAAKGTPHWGEFEAQLNMIVRTFNEVARSSG